MKKIRVLLITLMLILTLTSTAVADSNNDQNDFDGIGESSEVDNSLGLIISFVILFILIGVLFLSSKDMLPKTKKEKRIALRKNADTKNLDKYAKQVLDLLKKRGNRLTQKEIRDEIPEIGGTKISLIIAELEAIGKVKKIKRGRGNVIILKKHRIK